MRFVFVVVSSLILCGCEPQTAAEDLVGTWRGSHPAADFTTLELRDDNTFVRTARAAGMQVRSGGTYRVEHNAIRLRLEVEHISGARPETTQGEIVIPFRLEALTLVLYPNSDREQRLIMVK